MRWWRRDTAAFSLAALIAIGLALSGCSGGTKARSASTAATPSPAVSTTAAGPGDGWATAQALPVTPVAVAFQAKDPAFEALPGARAIFGTYEGGAYEIEVPDA